jgi:hypothetical protein
MNLTTRSRFREVVLARSTNILRVFITIFAQSVRTQRHIARVREIILAIY